MTHIEQPSGEDVRLWCPVLALQQQGDPRVGPFVSRADALDYAENGHPCTVAVAHRLVPSTWQTERG